VLPTLAVPEIVGAEVLANFLATVMLPLVRVVVARPLAEAIVVTLISVPPSALPRA